ncbi:MAG: LacI family DNA-binding transcriptional regulator [Eubacteriales bacterium]
MEERVSFNKSITSKDVARVAGVSQSTVSRVFNKSDAYGVKEEVREKVLQAAKEIGYSPNLVARGMISGKTNVIGLVVGDSLGPFYNRIVNEFVEKIQGIGKQCLVFKVPRQEQLRNITERVIQFQVEAVVITASAMTKVMAEAIVGNDIPVVLFNRFIPGVNINTVYVDPVEGAGMVAEHLAKKKHTNIGYIQFTKETGEEQEKKIGFYSKLRQYGVNQIQEETSGYNYQEGYDAGLRLLKGNNPPTAIFCTSDLIAMGVMDAARIELGLRVPEDVAVVGYDDIEMASWKAYQLTTIHQPVEEMISESIAMLERMVDGDKMPYVKMIKPELIERKSV